MISLIRFRCSVCKITINYMQGTDDAANVAIVREHYREHYRFDVGSSLLPCNFCNYNSAGG